MNAPDLTPGPGVRDAVLRRGRVLRRRRQAAWTTVGGMAAVAVLMAGGAVMRPTAGAPVDVLAPAPSTEAATGSRDATPTAAETASPTAAPSPTPTVTREPSHGPTAGPTSEPSARPSTRLISDPVDAFPTAPTPTSTGRGPSFPPSAYPDEYLDDHGDRRAYPGAYGTCIYRRDEDRASLFPTLEVTAGDVHVEGRTIFVTVTITNTGTTRLSLQEETMVPMDYLTQGGEQQSGTGTFSESTTLRHDLAPGESRGAVHRIHAANCGDSRNPRSALPAGQYQLVAAALVYPGAGGEGGPVYAAPVTVTLP